MSRQISRRVVLAMMGSGLLVPLNSLAPVAIDAASPVVTSNGSLVVLNVRGGLGDRSPIEGIILTVQRGQVGRVLARGLPFPFTGGLAPSPQGESLAYGADVDGLWLVNGNGTANRRLLLAPHSTAGIPLTIGAVAWSPDHSTLAFTSFFSGDVGAGPESRVGIWLTSPSALQPRLLATNKQIGAADSKGNPFAIERLSWSPDGRALAISTYRSNRGGPSTPVVLGVDVASGKSRILAVGGRDAVYAPTTTPNGTSVAYVTGDPGSPAGMTLVVPRTAKGSQPLHLTGKVITSPVWSPDGKALAYISGEREIDKLDLTTGKVSTVLKATQSGQRLLLPGGRFVRLAWMPAAG